MADIQIKDGNTNVYPVINKGVTYYTLLNGEQATTSLVSKTLYSERKLSDYNLLIATVVRGGGVRCSMAFTYSQFNSASSWISLTEVDSVNTQRWYEIHRISDTQVSIQKSNSASSETVYIFIYGIKLE